MEPAQDMPEKPVRRFSARQRRAMSAIARPGTANRPLSSRPRRPYSAYTRREDEAANEAKCDPPQTNREWWRFYVKDTPVPGSYKTKGFLDELQKAPNSYRFRDTSRVKSASHLRFNKSGEMLIPGAYEHEDFLQESGKKAMTCGFKGVERGKGPKIGHGYGDKELDISPNMYSIVEETSAVSEKGMKTSHFKSRVDRDIHLAHQFRIMGGPGPGQYESKRIKSAPAVSSMFRSQVSRFDGRPNKVPGPGTYSYNDSVFGVPKPVTPGAATHHLKKKHGLNIE